VIRPPHHSRFAALAESGRGAAAGDRGMALPTDNHRIDELEEAGRATYLGLVLRSMIWLWPGAALQANRRHDNAGGRGSARSLGDNGRSRGTGPVVCWASGTPSLWAGQRAGSGRLVPRPTDLVKGPLNI